MLKSLIYQAPLEGFPTVMQPKSAAVVPSVFLPFIPGVPGDQAPGAPASFAKQ